MPSRPELRLDWCSHEAAKFAVEHWHYSRSMPVGRLVKVGVWEGAAFIGCVVFAQGNNQYQGSHLGLTVQQVCELVRVALRDHVATVTRIISVAIRFLKKQSPGLRVVVSYADPAHAHHGGIYQAGNWTYVGTGGSSEAFFLPDGTRLHSRSVSPTGIKTQFGQRRVNASLAAVRRIALQPKHKYLMPLDAEMRAKIAPLAKPYPKPCEQSADSGTAVPTARGGATPTCSLQKAAA